MNLFDLPLLADRLQKIVSDREQDLRLEQAVHGLDKLSELQFHNLLATGLSPWYSLAREAPYPSSLGQKLPSRDRCDLVLTPTGRPMLPDWCPPDLFTPPNAALPGEALWLEVKIAWQFRELFVPHGGYATKWRDALIADLRKMEKDPMICQAALLLVAFTESRQIVEKDIELFETVLAQKEVLAGTRVVRSLEILDRIGHRQCTLALWPTIQRQEQANT